MSGGLPSRAGCPGPALLEVSVPTCPPPQPEFLRAGRRGSLPRDPCYGERDQGQCYLGTEMELPLHPGGWQLDSGVLSFLTDFTLGWGWEKSHALSPPNSLRLSRPHSLRLSLTALWWGQSWVGSKAISLEELTKHGITQIASPLVYTHPSDSCRPF